MRAARPQEVQGVLMRGKTTPLETRFWRKVSKGDDASCWEWQGHRLRSGYGWVNTPIGSRTASRVSAYLSGLLDDLASPLHVLHRCDNPSCCNPAHLFVGTNIDNIADRTAKGRSRTKPQHGQENGASKLTDTQIKQIRGMYRFAQYSQSQLAKMFNVHQPHISRIANGVRCGGVL